MGSGSFSTTRWSMVLSAKDANAVGARNSLAWLCQTYWYPLYSYVRRHGRSPEDAQDLTQEFLYRLLAKNWVADADSTKGRFRSFLLSAMKHFLADESDRARAQKRGGGMRDLPLEFGSAETRFVREPADESTPERNFERNWALTLLDDAVERLRKEYEDNGKGDLFATLHPCLVGERTAQPYGELAQRLGVRENTVKASVHRLRQRYRRLLRDAIADTVEEGEEVDEELRYLFSVLTG